MARLRDWWRRVTGRREAVQAPQPRTRSHASRPAASSGLELAEGPAAHKPTRVGEAGFDPYASDAGCQKPHAWERVDHD